jgi:predicted MFS family arabinose efflux permease
MMAVFRRHNDRSSRLSPSNALASRDFRFFVAGSVCYFCGWWLQRVTLAWSIWSTSRNPLWLGIFGFAEIVPIFVLTPLSGVLADRIDRINVLRTCQVLAAAIVIALAFLSIAGHLGAWLAVVMFSLRGAVNALYLPAALAFAPSLIDRQQLSSAISINSVVSNASLTVGPSLAGLLLLYSTPDVAYALSAILNVVFLALLFLISGRPLPRGVRTNAFCEATAGLSYAMKHAGIRSMLLIFLVVTLGARSLIDLLPGFAGLVTVAGPKVLSLFTGALGLGATSGSIWMSIAGYRDTAVIASYLANAFLIAIVAILLFASSDNLLVAIPAAFVIGLTIAINGIGTQTIVQQEVDETFRGRVMALYTFIFRAGWALGALVISAAATWIGLRWAGVGSALLCLAAWPIFRSGYFRLWRPEVPR